MQELLIPNPKEIKQIECERVHLPSSDVIMVAVSRDDGCATTRKIVREGRMSSKTALPLSVRVSSLHVANTNGTTPTASQPTNAATKLMTAATSPMRKAATTVHAFGMTTSVALGCASHLLENVMVTLTVVMSQMKLVVM